MKNTTRILAVSAFALTTAGCTDFLTGGELDSDPNRSLAASADNLFSAVQATAFLTSTSNFARTATMWMQGMAGTGQQYLSQGRYDVDEATFDSDFEFIYNQGGLVDIKNIERLTRTANDSLFLGIAQVYEAAVMGTMASIFGALPYSQAAQPDVFPTPELDAQSALYDKLQKLLDTAIVNLDGAGAGPSSDLNFNGNPVPWIQVAHTLKARMYMHWIEAQAANVAGAAVACGGAQCVARARSEALLGISASANDFKTRHTTLTGEENIWWQFIVVQRPGYMNAGRFLVDLLKARTGDPRLTQYFQAGSGAGGVINGADNGQTTTNTMAQLNGATRNNPVFAQPLATWAENKLILAEAEYRSSNETAARTHVNDVRTAAGYTTLVPVTTTGAALLTQIMHEKYIALFQSIEVWNDYKRTCLPALPVNGLPGVTQIPGRFYYGVQERQTNPNVPTVAQQDANDRNENDPNPCT